MSDKKMNDFPTAADGAFVYAEDANGNQIKISKADLASVVAELLSKTIQSDANNAMSLGDYNVSYEAANVPCSEWLAMKVFGRGLDIAQLAVGLNSGKTYTRKFNAEIGWSSWKRLDNV